MTSVDIGVAESSSTLDSESLQLSGTGAVYEDFVWESAALSTFGVANNNQTFEGDGGMATLVINEVDADQTSTDTARVC